MFVYQRVTDINSYIMLKLMLNTYWRLMVFVFKCFRLFVCLFRWAFNMFFSLGALWDLCWCPASHPRSLVEIYPWRIWWPVPESVAQKNFFARSDSSSGPTSSWIFLNKRHEILLKQWFSWVFNLSGRLQESHGFRQLSEFRKFRSKPPWPSPWPSLQGICHRWDRCLSRRTRPRRRWIVRSLGGAANRNHHLLFMKKH